MLKCESCYDGRVIAACCNGAGGCSCRGDFVDMGPCRVCGGSGWREDGSDPMANVHSIAGLCFIGSGPTDGSWPDGERGGFV